MNPKIVTLDIETAPLNVYCWGLWDQNIGLEMVADEWSILSFSARWLGNKKTLFRCTGLRGAAKVRDDKALCEQLWALLDCADIVVTQNGRAFDIPKINTRLIGHGFQPYSPIKIIDTKLAAKKHFGFTSNKLEWMAKFVNKTAQKSKHKKFPGFELWAECLKDNPAAWAEMQKYNAADVVATEELYLRMRPWIEGHPNVAVYSELETPMCPRCGSESVQHRGSFYTQTGEYHRVRCNQCGGWARSRYTLTTPGKRKKLLSG